MECMSLNMQSDHNNNNNHNNNHAHLPHNADNHAPDSAHTQGTMTTYPTGTTGGHTHRHQSQHKQQIVQMNQQHTHQHQQRIRPHVTCASYTATCTTHAERPARHKDATTDVLSTEISYGGYPRHIHTDVENTGSQQLNHAEQGYNNITTDNG